MNMHRTIKILISLLIAINLQNCKLKPQNVEVSNSETNSQIAGLGGGTLSLTIREFRLADDGQFKEAGQDSIALDLPQIQTTNVLSKTNEAKTFRAEAAQFALISAELRNDCRLASSEDENQFIAAGTYPFLLDGVTGLFALGDLVGEFFQKADVSIVARAAGTLIIGGKGSIVSFDNRSFIAIPELSNLSLGSLLVNETCGNGASNNKDKTGLALANFRGFFEDYRPKNYDELDGAFAGYFARYPAPARAAAPVIKSPFVYNYRGQALPSWGAIPYKAPTPPVRYYYQDVVPVVQRWSPMDFPPAAAQKQFYRPQQFFPQHPVGGYAQYRPFKASDPFAPQFNVGLASPHAVVHEWGVQPQALAGATGVPVFGASRDPTWRAANTWKENKPLARVRDAYQKIQGIRGVPKFRDATVTDAFGRQGAGIETEAIQGARDVTTTMTPAEYAQLEQTVIEAAKRGVFHNDLINSPAVAAIKGVPPGINNVMRRVNPTTGQSEIFVVDWGSTHGQMASHELGTAAGPDSLAFVQAQLAYIRKNFVR